MRPLRLLLDGFGCYRQPAEADFSDVDFFALIGPTGSGKSTVIDGLCFALYGTVPRWGKENVIAQALAPAANACRVCLVFEAGGKRYARGAGAGPRQARGQVHTKEARLDRLDPAVPAGRAARRPARSQLSSRSLRDPTRSRRRSRRSWGSPTSTSPSRCCCRRAGSPTSSTPEPRNRQDLLVELLAFGVYEKIGQQARDRARLAAERARAGAGATRPSSPTPREEAEERAAARVRGLSDALAGRRRPSCAPLRHSGPSRPARRPSRPRPCAPRPGLLAAVRAPAGVPGLADRITAADARVTARAQKADDAAEAEDGGRTRPAARCPRRLDVEALRDAHTSSSATAHRAAGQAAAGLADAPDGILDALAARTARPRSRTAEQARAAREAAQQAHAAYAAGRGPAGR